MVANLCILLIHRVTQQTDTVYWRRVQWQRLPTTVVLSLKTCPRSPGKSIDIPKLEHLQFRRKWSFDCKTQRVRQVTRNHDWRWDRGEIMKCNKVWRGQQADLCFVKTGTYNRHSLFIRYFPGHWPIRCEKNGLDSLIFSSCYGR